MGWLVPLTIVNRGHSWALNPVLRTELSVRNELLTTLIVNAWLSRLSRASALHFPCRGSVARLPKSGSSCRHSFNSHSFMSPLFMPWSVAKTSKLAFYNSLLKSLRKTFTQLAVWSRPLRVCTLLWCFTVVHLCRMFFLFLSAIP